MHNEELLGEFVAEAETHVNIVEEGLLSLESGEAEGETINELFRSLHSIKGTAGFFSLSNIVDLSHAMENYFSEIRKGSFKISAQAVDILLGANDCLKQMINNVEQSDNTPISTYLEQIKSLFPEEKEEAQSNVEQDQPAERLTAGDQVDHPEEQQGEDNSCRQQDSVLAGELFREATQHGQKLYQLKLEAGHHPQSDSELLPDGLINSISSIGQVIQTFKDQQNWIILFSSVLEASLATMALNIPEEKITELTDPSQIPSFPDEASLTSESSNNVFPDPDQQHGQKEPEPLEVGLKQDQANLEQPEQASCNQET